MLIHDAMVTFATNKVNLLILKVMSVHVRTHHVHAHDGESECDGDEYIALEYLEKAPDGLKC